MECCNQINANKSFRPFRFAALLGEKAAAGARSTSFKHKDLSDHCITGRLRYVGTCMPVSVTMQGLASLSVTRTKQK